MNVIGEVEGKRCVLIDDIVDSGGTLCNAAEALLKYGATEVSAYITHGVLSRRCCEPHPELQAKIAGHHGLDPADRSGQGSKEHPRALHRAAHWRSYSRTSREESVSSLFY